MTALLRFDQLPALDTVPDDALLAVWTANRLWAAPRSAVGSGGGPGTGGYNTVRFENENLPQRTTIVVDGLLQASDSGGRTLLTLPDIDLDSQVTGVLPIASGGTGLSVPGSIGQSLRYNAGGLLEAYTPSAGLNAPASPADNGKVAVGSGGNLVYSLLTTSNLSPSAGVKLTQLDTMNAARLLGRDAGSGTPVELSVGGGVDFTGSGGIERSALTGAVSAPAGSNATAFASGDFGSLNLNTTGYLRLGLTPGSGSGVRSAASTGDLRLPRGGFSAFGRNNSDNTDVLIWDWDSVNNRIILGDASNISTGYIYLQSNLIQLRCGTNSTLDINTAVIQPQINKLSWGTTVPTAPLITQDDNTANSGVGKKFTGRAQSCTGPTSTGGDLDWGPGAGTTQGGLGRLISGSGVARVSWNDIGIGFFGATCVARPADAGALTDSTGGAVDGTLVDVGVVFNQANINNNFADCADKINKIRAALRTLGLMT